jgi:hypothetical protein
MKINTKKFFLSDVYSYDISACHYRILESMGFNVSVLDKDNKEKRNIAIGKIMGENQVISSMLRTTTESLISEYIKRNGLEEDDILIRQYDGFLTKKLLYETDKYLPLQLKETFQKMIVSINKDKYIATNEKSTIVKGVANNYSGIEIFFKELLDINFVSKNEIFNCLKKIKDGFSNCKDVNVFSIPYDETFNMVIFKTYGQIKVSKQVSKMIEHNDIDKQKYYDIYLKEFVQGIIIDFI